MVTEPEVIGGEYARGAGDRPAQGPGFFEATDLPPRAVEDGDVAQRDLADHGDEHRNPERAEPDLRRLQCEPEQRRQVEQHRPSERVQGREQYRPVPPKAQVGPPHGLLPPLVPPHLPAILLATPLVSYTHLTLPTKRIV